MCVGGYYCLHFCNVETKVQSNQAIYQWPGIIAQSLIALPPCLDN